MAKIKATHHLPLLNLDMDIHILQMFLFNLAFLCAILFNFQWKQNVNLTMMLFITINAQMMATSIALILLNLQYLQILLNNKHLAGTNNKKISFLSIKEVLHSYST